MPIGAEFLFQRIVALEEQLRAKNGIKPLHLAVHDDLKKKILARQYVDLATLLPQKRSATAATKAKSHFVEDEAGRLVPHRGASEGGELGLDDWTSAFTRFASVVLKEKPELTQDLLAYLETIREAAREHGGDKWRQYDSQFRQQMAVDPATNWGSIDPALWLKNFTAPSSTPPSPTSAAPPATTAAQGQRPPPKQEDRSKRTSESGGTRGACHYYNSDRGCFRRICSFRHSCRNCQSNQHGASSCPEKQRRGQQSKQSTDGQPATAPSDRRH